MRRLGPGTTLLIAALVAAPGAAFATPEGRVRPAIVFLIDVPATMNLLPGSSDDPDCAGGQRSRYLLVREALTGSFDDFSCSLVTEEVFDEPAFASEEVRHPKASYSGQGDDGFIDRYAEDVRFGLLVSEPIEANGDGPGGGYSYPAPGEPYIETGGVSLGARNEDAKPGAMLGIGNPGAGTNVVHHNDDVQAELNKVIPFGRTSLAALLTDARFYFAEDALFPTHGRMHEDNACRPFRVVLITDGRSRPDYDDDANPEGPDEANGYGAATTAAAALARDNRAVQVIVLDPGDIGVLDRMDALAAAGGTGEAWRVRTLDELRVALEAPLSEVMAGTDSRTRSATTFQTHDDRLGQMVASAAYTVPADGAAWYGHFERLDYECGADVAKRVVRYGELLDLQRNRGIWTMLAGAAASFSTENDDLTDVVLGVSSDRVDDLIGFVRGEDGGVYGTRAHKLGPIIRSSPVIVGPPLLDLPYPAYQGGFVDADGDPVPGYKEAHKERATVAYTGANDGMVHAFVLGTAEADSELRNQGPEAWAYVPGYFLGDLARMTTAAGVEYYLDGPPATRTVRLWRQAETAPEDEVWRDVLVGGAGRGGRVWYALDVSEVVLGEAPGVLWELPGDVGGYPAPKPDIAAWDGGLARPDQYLGETWAQPAFGTVVVMEEGQRTERAVAFLPGGRERDAGTDQGKAFYVARLEKDVTLGGLPRVLRTFRTGLGNQEDDLRFPIVGAPVAYLDSPGIQTTRVFVGDSGGRLWRIDTSATDPDEWRMDMVFDPFAKKGGGNKAQEDAARRAAVEPPAVAQRANGSVVVVYGTGDVSDLASPEGGHHVWSLTEEITLDEDGAIDEVGMRPNWDIPLAEGERQTGNPLIFDDVVYFPTFTHTEDSSCGPGEGRIWAVDFVGDDDDEEVTDDVLPRFPSAKAHTRTEFVEDDPPDCGDELPAQDSPDQRALYCKLDGAVVAGLHITYWPSCSDDFLDWGRAPKGGAAAGVGKPQLVAQTGATRSAGAGRDTPQQGGQPLANKIRLTLPSAGSYSMPLSWGVVYE